MVRSKASTSKKKTRKRTASKKKTAPRKAAGIPGSREYPPRVNAAVRKAAEELWSTGVKPHGLIHELKEVLLLRCLKEADGNYAAAADLFGPSRQSAQQYANSSLRDERWRPYQQNRRRKG